MADAVLLEGFPNLRQAYDYDCGANALQSVLAYYGIDTREDKILHIAKTTGDGTNPGNLALAIEHYGLQHEALEMTVADVKEFIKRGIPVIVLLQAWTKTPDTDWKNDWKDGHYVVAIGYDDEKVIFEDPSSFHRTYLSNEALEERWHDVDENGNKYVHWGIAVYGKEPSLSYDKPIPMG